MEKKKSNKANLEKMKTLFFVISLGIVFAFINFAFNINSKTSENNTKISGIPVEGDRIPITRPPDEKPKPLKPITGMVHPLGCLLLLFMPPAPRSSRQ